VHFIRAVLSRVMTNELGKLKSLRRQLALSPSCGSQLPRVPQSLFPLDFMPLYNQYNFDEMTLCDIEGQIIKVSVSFTLLSLITHTKKSQLPCSKNNHRSLGKAT
jgi:hypothetical protein